MKKPRIVGNYCGGEIYWVYQKENGWVIQFESPAHFRKWYYEK